MLSISVQDKKILLRGAAFTIKAYDFFGGYLPVDQNRENHGVCGTYDYWQKRVGNNMRIDLYQSFSSHFRQSAMLDSLRRFQQVFSKPSSPKEFIVSCKGRSAMYDI
jgi:hypothetical protein